MNSLYPLEMCAIIWIAEGVWRCLYIIFWPVRCLIRFCCSVQCVKRYFSFAAGVSLAQLYYYFFLKKISLPYSVDRALSLGFSVLLGLGNAACIQLRCISLLTLAMYCGKPGRGVMKAVVLTYVIAGPITNMGLNAREVVRVFACTTELAYNLTKARHSLIAQPLRRSLEDLEGDVQEIKETIRSIETVISPIENEIEGTKEITQSRVQNDYVDDIFERRHHSEDIEKKYSLKQQDEEKDVYQKKYLMKLEIRCVNQFARSITICMNMFRPIHDKYYRVVTTEDGWAIYQPLDLRLICNIQNMTNMDKICDSSKQLDPGLGEGYAYLKKAAVKLTNLDDIKLENRLPVRRVLYNIQDAKETGERVIRAFEEKSIIMNKVITIINVCMALLFLRIPSAAAAYHDFYLTNIEYDNTYVTGYFKKIDRRRQRHAKFTLLPLKKMERLRYIDVQSFSYLWSEHGMLVSHMLKVFLEVVTATTFVMLDRLFYEALDVVRQHAEVHPGHQGTHDLDITVEGTSALASMVRKVLKGYTEELPKQHPISSHSCLPQPRLMPPAFFFKIYGGYLWIIILLYLDPYTLRLRRLICSYFYPRREKQRILHLYNDILKKRMKMQKTLRRKAVQAVRAHYLSGENLLSLRMKFPQLLGWLRVLPAARMTCLICRETEPRVTDNQEQSTWHSCAAHKCPFVCCTECWHEVGSRCLACDPSLVELSDMDSLSDDEQPRH